MRVGSGVFPLEEVLRVCLPLAEDIVASTADVKLAILSPTSLLLMGQADTLDRFGACMARELPDGIQLWTNEGRWAPLHTPIIWEKNLCTRFVMSMHTMKGGLTPAARSLSGNGAVQLRRHQRPRTAGPLGRPATTPVGCHPRHSADRNETVVHVGPQPSVIRSTFVRLQHNVENRTRAGLGLRWLSAFVSRRWFRRLLPKRAALLRVTGLEHVSLEDWLLSQEMSPKPSP
jgi:[acyl-carrier-protein] S-malonyltransferase